MGNNIDHEAPQVRNQRETTLIARFVINGKQILIARFVIKDGREVRKGKLKLTTRFPTKGMKITINRQRLQSHIINEQSHISMRHGAMYKEAGINLFLHAQPFRCLLGI